MFIMTILYFLKYANQNPSLDVTNKAYKINSLLKIIYIYNSFLVFKILRIALGIRG